MTVGRKGGDIRHAFETAIKTEFAKDESGNDKVKFHKQENTWEKVTIETKVHEHLNSPHFKRIEGINDHSDTIAILNAVENENYHKELMFMERQLLKMRLFNKIDREKIEKKLDEAWDKKEKNLNEWSFFSWFQKLFFPTQYFLSQKDKEEKCEQEYQQIHTNAEKNVTLALNAEKSLKDAIELSKQSSHRKIIARSCMRKADFTALQEARERFAKE